MWKASWRVILKCHHGGGYCHARYVRHSVDAEYANCCGGAQKRGRRIRSLRFVRPPFQGASERARARGLFSCPFLVPSPLARSDPPSETRPWMSINAAEEKGPFQICNSENSIFSCLRTFYIAVSAISYETKPGLSILTDPRFVI